MVRVGVVGCAHGQFDAIYSHIEAHNRDASPGEEVELLLCCGDVQCLRNTNDLECEACPKRYRHMNEFHEYYSGMKKASVLTIVIGGNHEASNYLQEIHYGGWIAHNMFYLGAAGVINVMGLRIGGVSGIYDARDYHKGHYERVPYTKKALHSVFHTREMEIYQLSHLTGAVDIMMSHDWPRKIEDYGDKEALLKNRRHFEESIAKDEFGSVGGELLLHQLKPKHWFAGHMHVRFEATVEHTASALSLSATATQFLALDKCHRDRPWFEIVDVEPSMETPPLRANGDVRVLMDVEWLAILRATHHVVSRRPNDTSMPVERRPIDDSDRAWVRRCLDEAAMGERVAGEWIGDFEVTAPGYGYEDALWFDGALGNPQTDGLLDLLKLPHVVTSPYTAEDGESNSSDDDTDDNGHAKTNTRSASNDEFLEDMMGSFQF